MAGPVASDGLRLSRKFSSGLAHPPRVCRRRLAGPRRRSAPRPHGAAQSISGSSRAGSYRCSTSAFTSRKRPSANDTRSRAEPESKWPAPPRNPYRTGGPTYETARAYYRSTSRFQGEDETVFLRYTETGMRGKRRLMTNPASSASRSPGRCPEGRTTRLCRSPFPNRSKKVPRQPTRRAPRSGHAHVRTRTTRPPARTRRNSPRV